MASDKHLDLQTTLDGLGTGVLVFASSGALIAENLAARNLLGLDINRIRDGGWAAACALFNEEHTSADDMIESACERAIRSARPVRFHLLRGGEYLPCWAAAVIADNGDLCTLISIDAPDWTAMTLLLDRFQSEVKEAVYATQGHAELIVQAMRVHDPEDGVEMLKRRVGGFTRLIGLHMHRVNRLTDMMQRMEDIRTGHLREIIRQRRRNILLSDYFEDFVEDLDEIVLVDPETEARDHRSRLTVSMPPGLRVIATRRYLTQILQDILRNAIMYSESTTPIQIVVTTQGDMAQFSVSDQGHGIREPERGRVFAAFQRARQPQIISEFGYGLSLYLCKHEVEAMNGHMRFDSEEGVGTTFHFTLPVWRESSASVSSSDTETAAS